MSPTQENIYIKTEQEIRLTVEYNYESWESVINLDDYRCYGCENNQDLEFFLTKFVKNDKVSFTFNDTHLQIYFTIDLGFKKITKVIILPKVRTLTDVEKLKYQLTEKECENKCLKDQLEIFPKQMVICNSIITRDMTDCIPVIPKIPPGITYKKYYDFINNCLQKNIEILPLLIKVGYGIDWDDLSSNPNAVHILEKNLDKVDWDCLSGNPNAIHILEKNIDKVDWDCLSGNPNAVHILEKNIDKVDWGDLSWNPNAVHILEKNIDKVDWEWLSGNPNAIHILEKNLDKVDWDCLSDNPNFIQSYFYSTSNKLSVLDKISQISNLLSSLRTYFYVSQIAEMQKNLKLKDSKIEEMKNKLVNLVTDCNNKIVDIEREHYRQLHSLPAYSHFR